MYSTPQDFHPYALLFFNKILLKSEIWKVKHFKNVFNRYVAEEFFI